MKNANPLLLADQIEFILNVIIKKAKLEKNGVFWYTNNEGSGLYFKSKNESIANGGCGILLFLIEVYKIKKEPTLLDVIQLGIDWAIDYTKKNKSPFSFYTGKAGVVYTAIKAYELTHDDQFLKKSELLVEETDLDQWIESQDVELNLYEGLAGALLVLLHLHYCTQSNRTLEIIGKLTKRLLREVKMATSGGIYWSRGKQLNQIKELCGFAEGTAGISYVFTELGAYFRNPAFFWIAQQSTIYENSFYNEKRQNWPNFHKGRITKNDLRKLSWRHKWGISRSYFAKPTYCDSWDHGRTGIALSRARCYQATRNEKCAEDFEKAARGVAYRPNKSSYPGNCTTLKQGLPGVIMLMLEAYRSMNEPLFLDRAKQAARALWKIYAKNLGNARNFGTVDPTLFTGAAGIGYCLIALGQAEQENYSCITRPDVPTTEKNLDSLLPAVLKFSEHDIIGYVLQSNFPKTFHLLEKIKLTESICEFTKKNSTMQIIQDLSAKITSRGLLQLKDILDYEEGKRALIASVSSKLDLRIKKYNEALFTKPLLETNHAATLLHVKLIAASGTRIHTSKWPWHSEEPAPNEDQDEEYFTLFSTGIGEEIEEYRLDKTSAYFLSKFKRPIRSVDVFNQICKENSIHENEKNEMMEILTQQLMYFLGIGAVVRSGTVDNLFSNLS